MRCRLVFYILLCQLVLTQRPPGGQRPPGQQGPPQQPPQNEPPEEEKEECGVESYEPKGEIESPNYPDNYPNDADCLYRLFTNKIINVYFESFHIEETDDCTYDYLQVVFDAMSPGAGPERYCGEGLGKVNGGHLRGKGPLIMMFRSDDSETKSGYKFTFEYELDGPDPCDSDPCQNGGSCERLVGYYKCHCEDGYVGVNCQEDMDDCASYPCEHGGQCQDGLNSYTCDCINGFTGDICEIDPDPCASNPCQNGGLCVNRIPDYVCSCPRTFMGDMCEEEVPTLPPPTTVLPETKTTTKPAEVVQQPATGADVPDAEDPKGTNEEPEEKDKTTADNDDGGKTGIIIAIVVIVLLALIMAGIFAWFWFKHQRKTDDTLKKRELTLINMKTTAELGETGKTNSRTTSINVVNSKGGGKKSDEFLNQLQRMSQDIIMEEVNSDDQMNKESKGRRNAIHASNMQRHSQSNLHSNPPIKRISVPISHDEVEMMQNSPTVKRMSMNRQSEQKPVKISPEDAVSLLNYLKNNDEKKCDLPTALYAVQNQQRPIQSLYPNYHEHQPLPKHLPYETKHEYPATADGSMGSIDLTPTEAADVVNYLLTKSPTHGKLNPQEALEVMKDVRDRRKHKRNYSQREKEKTVILNPQEVANIVNSFDNRNHRSKDRPSKWQNRTRGFRTYTPILEEDSLQDEPTSQQNLHYSESPSENETEHSPKNQNHSHYAHTIDPEEKVYDWLKSTPNRKKSRRRYSPTNSTATETHTVTRTFPQPQRHRRNRQNGRVENDMAVMDYDDDGRSSVALPRTIRQTRVKMANANHRPSLPVTENKAKSLVEKLVKAPARSNQNVVAPSLGVKRQNAFLD